MRHTVYGIPIGATTRASLWAKCKPTQEQRRTMYLANRAVLEYALAREWRQSRACDRCGYPKPEHASWCEWSP